jgi:hypothetical protein
MWTTKLFWDGFAMGCVFLGFLVWLQRGGAF